MEQQMSEEMFEYIKGYSPVHNVSGEHYPATMVTTEITINCLRIVFLAELQEKQTGNDPC
jgi:prolyl oligopeptidase